MRLPTQQEWDDLLYLLDDWTVYVSDGALVVMCNDYFAPAADSEDCTLDDLHEIRRLYDEHGNDGPMQWVADKRGVPNESWKDRYDRTEAVQPETAGE